MKVFISLKAPRGDPELEELASQVSALIRESGHQAFVAPRQIEDQGLTDPKDFIPFFRQHAAACDLMIVLYHPELRGCLIELGMA